MAGESGVITVTTSGTPVAGPATPAGSVFLLSAHPDNTDTVWIGTKTNGYPLQAKVNTAIRYCATLAGMQFDADVSGEKICFLLVQ